MKQTTTTRSAQPADFPANTRPWAIVDAEGVVLGKLATKVANVLRGKDKPNFTPHVDTGSFVVVVNAEKVKLTGQKLDQKLYRRHSGYLGSLKSTTAREMLDKKPEEVIRHAVAGMLPHNKLANVVIGKLKIYAGSKHPHAGQKPVPLEV